jgi:hypothetical protein
MRHGTAELPHTATYGVGNVKHQTVSKYSGNLPSDPEGRTDWGCWKKIFDFKIQNNAWTEINTFREV